MINCSLSGRSTDRYTAGRICRRADLPGPFRPLAAAPPPQSPPRSNLLPLPPPIPHFSVGATDTNKMATKTDDDFKTWDEATTALGHTQVWNNRHYCGIQTGCCIT